MKSIRSNLLDYVHHSIDCHTSTGVLLYVDAEVYLDIADYIARRCNILIRFVSLHIFL